MTRISAPTHTPLPGALSLGRNISWTTAGNIVYAACQWGVLAVIAKLGTPVMVGMFALGLAITTPVIQLANLQLRGVQATDARGEHPFRDYFTLRITTTLLALAVMAAIALAGGHGRETTIVIVLIAGAKAIDAISDVFYGHFQQRERMDRVARAQAANGVISLLLVAGAMALTGSITAAVTGFLLGSLLPLAGYTVPVAIRELRGGASAELFRWDPPALRRLAWTALPLGIVMMLVALNANIPRYVVEAELGQGALGIFAALAYLIVAGETVVNAIGQAASPRLARLFAEGDLAGFRALLTRLFGVGLGLGMAGAAAAWLAGEHILRLLYTSRYAEEVPVLIVLALAAGMSFAASFAGYGMTAARQFRVQVPVFATVTGLSLIASLVLVPRVGLEGAAVSLGLAAAVQLGLAAYVVFARALPAEGGSAS